MNYSSWIALLALLFGLTLILVTLASLLLRGDAMPRERIRTPARVFLVCLRLAIGWHCFVEGMDKLTTPGWSSEAYLREESIGPFSGVFRWVAGDRLIDKLTVIEVDGVKQVPAALAADYDAYTAAFIAHNKLSGEPAERARDVLKQGKSKAVTWLTTETETVQRIAPYPPPLKVDWTIQERVEEYERLKQKVAEAERALPTTDKDLKKKYTDAKANLAKWRGDLKKSYDAQFASFKKELGQVPLSMTPDLGVTPQLGVVVIGLVAVPDASVALRTSSTVLAGRTNPPPLPEPVSWSVASWGMLEWSDFFVKWGLVVIGAALMIGLFSRPASAAGALLIFSFFLAIPPLPGWPESPRLEGHYLFINKTLIEVLALGALAFLPTGRWAGVDALICAIWSWQRRETAPAVKARTVAKPHREAVQSGV
jgi:uncharacterized membrane protein YphA (DoxX/SURF4 family)